MNRLLKCVFHVVFGLGVAAMTACGGSSDTDGSSSVAIQFNGSVLQVTNGRTVAKATSENLLELDRSWRTWAGQASGVTYDAQSGVLNLPAATSDRPMTIAVERFDLPLVANTEYTLTLQTSDPQIAAVLFLFDTSGAIVPVPGITEALAFARAGTPLVFSAPENIAGIYLQVQNRWQADENGSLTAQLTYQQDENPTGDDRVELVDTSGPWTDWSGNASGVAADPVDGLLTIDIPEPGAGMRIGTKRFNTALDAGKTYTLSTRRATANGAASLLFLFAADDSLIPFVDEQSGEQRRWLSAVGNQQIHFVAPADVVSFAIQVQSAWLATEPTSLLPSLTTATTDDPAPCTAELANVSAPNWLSENGAVGTSATWSSLSISDNGRWVTFASDSDGLLANDPNPARQMRLYLYDAQSGQLEKLLPTNGSVSGNYRTPVISGNGEAIFFLTDNGVALDGQATVAGQFDLFRFQRVIGGVDRITNAPHQTNISRIVRVSADANRVLFTGSAAALLADQVVGTELAGANLIEYDAASSAFTPILLSPNAQSESVVASSDLNQLVYRTRSIPEFINGTFVGNTSADYIFSDRTTNTSTVVANTGDNGPINTIYPIEYYTRSHAISGDGEYVVFAGNQQPFSSGGHDFSGVGFYRWERRTNRIVAVTQTNTTVAPTAPYIAYPTLSAAGDIVAFRETQFLAPLGTTISRTLIYDIDTERAAPTGYDTSGHHPALSADGLWLAELHRSRVTGLMEGAVRSALNYACP